MYTVDYTFELFDLGEHFGYAEGEVIEGECGYIEVKIKKAVVHLRSKDGKHQLDLDVTHFIDNPTRNNIAEKIEGCHIVSKARGA